MYARSRRRSTFFTCHSSGAHLGLFINTLYSFFDRTRPPYFSLLGVLNPFRSFIIVIAFFAPSRFRLFHGFQSVTICNLTLEGSEVSCKLTFFELPRHRIPRFPTRPPAFQLILYRAFRRALRYYITVWGGYKGLIRASRIQI